MSVVSFSRSAVNGSYGAVPHDPSEGLGRALLAAIRAELSEADYFTREDLLQLDVFDHVTTITKYRRLCLAVHYLLRTGAIVSKSRTDLCLPGKSKSYPGGAGPLHEHYLEAITGLAQTMGRKKLFSVGDVVRKWTQDPHLTPNVKRILVRRTLGDLVRKGALSIEGENEFYWEAK